MNDDRIIDIESKLAHQDDMLNQLNAALTSQQSQISRLESLCETLADRLRSQAEGGPESDPADERPPHY